MPRLLYFREMWKNCWNFAAHSENKSDKMYSLNPYGDNTLRNLLTRSDVLVTFSDNPFSAVSTPRTLQGFLPIFNLPRTLWRKHSWGIFPYSYIHTTLAGFLFPSHAGGSLKILGSRRPRRPCARSALSFTSRGGCSVKLFNIIQYYSIVSLIAAPRAAEVSAKAIVNLQGREYFFLARASLVQYCVQSGGR